MPAFVMAFDQGTTSSRCILFNRDTSIHCIAQKEFPQLYPQPGWVEHDPMALWSSQLSVAVEAMQKANLTAKDIAAIGITNQRETTVVWDKRTGEPIANAIVWQCRRTASLCDALKAQGLAADIRARTGLQIDAYFSATKLAWLLDNVPHAREDAENGHLLFGTVDTWLIWKLTRGKVHATDYSNASRTMLFNIHTLDWDDELLRLFRIPRGMLPVVKPSSHIYGYADASFFGGEIPIGGVAGDQQAALFGQQCFAEGAVKNTYGTGCFILMNTGSRAIESKNGLLTTIAWGLDGKITYALEGGVFVAGAAMQWLRDGLRVIDNAAESESLALSVADTGGVYFVPAFVGLGAPHWEQNARGMAVGITRGTSQAEFVRAALESLAYQSADVIHAMEADAALTLSSIAVDGGACRNSFLMQFQADILNATVLRPRITESTALGAMLLAGLTAGIWNGRGTDAITRTGAIETVFRPEMDETRRNTLLAGWHKAVRCAAYWAHME